MSDLTFHISICKKYLYQLRSKELHLVSQGTTRPYHGQQAELNLPVGIESSDTNSHSSLCRKQERISTCDRSICIHLLHYLSGQLSKTCQNARRSITKSDSLILEMSHLISRSIVRMICIIRKVG
jgi:hypothetical protein